MKHSFVLAVAASFVFGLCGSSLARAQPLPVYDLTVRSYGAAAIVISSSNGFGGTTDYTQENIAAATAVELQAPLFASPGFIPFKDWYGCDSVSGRDCTVFMNSKITVVANYADTAPYLLNVFSTGSANVVIASSSGYGGTTNYTLPIAPATAVDLVAPGTSGSMDFNTWNGCDSITSGGATCNVTMSGDKTVVAEYDNLFELFVNSIGANNVPITSSSGHSGTTDYVDFNIPSGTVAELTAPPRADGAYFLAWGGCDSVSGACDSVCSVSVSGDREVVVEYWGSDYLELPGQTYLQSAGCGAPIPDPPDNRGADPVMLEMTIDNCMIVEDVAVGLNISHSWIGDLFVEILAPDGTSVIIVDRPGNPDGGLFGCVGSDINAVLDDDVPIYLEDECRAAVPTAGGIFAPNNPLAAIEGVMGTGKWTIKVQDLVSGDTGYIHNWSLRLVCAEPELVFCGGFESCPSQ